MRPTLADPCTWPVGLRPTIDLQRVDSIPAMRANWSIVTRGGCMRRAVLATGCALLATACVNGSIFQPLPPPPPSEPYKSPEERFNDRWAGKPEDDVLVQYGKPLEVVQLSNGNHLNSYHREVV